VRRVRRAAQALVLRSLLGASSCAPLAAMIGLGWRFVAWRLLEITPSISAGVRRSRRNTSIDLTALNCASS
jgi:hypothetical protein